MAKLLVHESAGVREFEIVDDEVRMGRELDNTLRLPDPSISRHHCVLRKVGEAYEIQDLQSSNGVLVNGNRVQTSPLRNGDRITLGQVQLTFEDPRPEPGPTVAISREDVPAPPLGTVRMSAAELAAIHTGNGAPGGGGQGSTGPIPVPAPSPAAASIPPAPLVAPPPVAPKPPVNAPEFGHFTNAGTQANPAPGFLQPYLPPLPDDAQPTGERGDFVTRLLAALIDLSPMLILSVLGMILIGPTMAAGGLGSGIGLGAGLGLGCLLGLIQLLLGLGYLFFIPWCWIRFGATPGKKIMGLRVVPEANPLGRLDVGGAVLRMLGYLLNAIIAWVIALPVMFGLAFIGLTTGFGFGTLLLSRLVSFGIGLIPYLMILGGERKGLQDLLSKSLVIKVDR